MKHRMKMIWTAEIQFLLRVKMNSINWPAPNIWVFIAQLVEHCSANAEAMGSNPVEALKKFFSGLNLQLLKLRLKLRWSNLYFICISAVHIIFILQDHFGSQNSLKLARYYKDDWLCAIWLYLGLKGLHKQHILESLPCAKSMTPLKRIPGFFSSNAVIKCIRSFSASSEIWSSKNGFLHKV